MAQLWPKALKIVFFPNFTRLEQNVNMLQPRAEEDQKSDFSFVQMTRIAKQDTISAMAEHWPTHRKHWQMLERREQTFRQGL